MEGEDTPHLEHRLHTSLPLRIEVGTQWSPPAACQPGSRGLSLGSKPLWGLGGRNPPRPVTPTQSRCSVCCMPLQVIAGVRRYSAYRDSRHLGSFPINLVLPHFTSPPCSSRIIIQPPPTTLGVLLRTLRYYILCFCAFNYGPIIPKLIVGVNFLPSPGVGVQKWNHLHSMAAHKVFRDGGRRAY